MSPLDPHDPHATDAEGGVSRRDVLAAAGFGLAAVGLSGCGRPPVTETVPALRQPEEVVPGRAVWYASTCGGCPAGCGVLVKCRDGRPIKVEGNPDHPLSRGGLCAVGQAQVVSLYDGRRLFHPTRDGSRVPWEEADREVVLALAAAKAAGRGVRLLTQTVTSPTTREGIASFLADLPDARHVAYDPLSASAILEANGRVGLPRWRIEEAEAIVGVDADFLGTWISPVEFTKGWRAARSLEGAPPRFAWHLQVEPTLTLTGSDADRRLALPPAAIGPFVAHLAARVAERAGRPSPARPAEPLPVPEERVEEAARRLWEARPRGLLLCGTNDLAVQVLVREVNAVVGARTVPAGEASFQRQGDDRAYAALLDELEAGKVDVLVVAGANPVADAPEGSRFRAAMERAKVRVALAERPDETTAAATWVLPLPHALEAWDDAEPVSGLLSTTQPAIAPLGEPRSLRECLAAWRGRPRTDREVLRESWGTGADRTVHDGFAVRGGAALPRAAARPEAPPPAALATPAPGRFALVLYPTVGLLDGRHAQNPWLQEMPDPIAKTVWGNAAALSPADAQRLGVGTGDVVRVSARSSGPGGGASVEVPVLVQPGVATGVVAVALGHGRAGTDRFADVGPSWLQGKPTVRKGGTVGVSVSPFLALQGGLSSLSGREVTVEPTGRHEELALSQTWSSQTLPLATSAKGHERRGLVRETTVDRLALPAVHGHEAEDIWDQDHAYAGHRWGMVIDLSACTGCSACVVACQAENNLPVVGRDEVLRRRDMAWMRIDRYYEESADGGVDVVHQPMLCHHCENAPCETVCPVAATVHTSEGLNAQAYNRCVGTRYCANNCPFKVRRFNWFDYPRGDSLANLVLNPDVTVRSRGVMEKCSFCVQRIHEAKAEAKRERRPLKDGEVRPACEQSCPAGAIVFGDVNAAESAAARASADPRRYRLLDELNLRASVSYRAKVRHREAGGPAEGESHG